ncbi:MAG: UPF0182 family protein, partial [Gemmatimonadota bacterium]
PLVLMGLALSAGTGLLTHLVAPAMEQREAVSSELARPIAALATGLERLHEEPAPPDAEPGRPPGPGLWSREAIALLLQVNGGQLLALSPSLVEHHGERIPAWLAVRTTTDGPEVVVIAEDRLAAGGAPVSFRDGDPAGYPGVVSWRRLSAAVVRPSMRDTVAAQGAGGIALGGAWRRLLLAWGTQSMGTLGGAQAGAALWWRMAPRERASRLFPPAWWDEARPLVVDGRMAWLVDGWLTVAGAPLAPAFPWEGEERRYARPAFGALIDAITGETRFYLRSDADALARAWADRTGGMIAPADSAPEEVRLANYPDRSLAIQAWALQHGPYGLSLPSIETGADSVLLRPAMTWTETGPAPQLPIGHLLSGGRTTGRLIGVLIGRAGTGPVLARWTDGAGMFGPRTLIGQWQRFASFERLQDSVGAANGRILESPVRFDIDSDGTWAVQVLYLIPANGAPSVGWVNLARRDRLGAARTPATAWANLKGESAPIVPAPDLPDALIEARRWAARADSALRAGDLQS